MSVSCSHCHENSTEVCCYCGISLCHNCWCEHQSDCANESLFTAIFKKDQDGFSQIICLSCFLDQGGDIKDADIQAIPIGQWSIELDPRCVYCSKELVEYLV